MLIEQQASWALVRVISEVERRWLTDYLMPPPVRGYLGVTTGASLYDGLAKRFPRGLLHLVLAAAPTEGIEVKVLDGRRVPCMPTPEVLDPAWLRDYQSEAVLAVCSKHQGLVQAATAAGKGDIAVALPLAIPCRWLFLVHRGQLAKDIAQRWREKTGEEAGFVGEGEFKIGKRLTCATLQTLARALADPQSPRHRDIVNLLSTTEGVIADEAHVGGAAPTFVRVLMACKAYFRVGLSATPLDRGDGRNLLVVGAFGPTLTRKEVGALIEEGWIAKPLIHMVPFSHVKPEWGLDTPPAATAEIAEVLEGARYAVATIEAEAAPAPEFADVYKRMIVESAGRNALLTEIARYADKPGLLFVKDIEHGKTLTRLTADAGMRVEMVSGTVKTAMREAAVKRLRRNDLDIIVCSVVFQEGINAPELRSVIVGSGGASKIAALQRNGRGMRMSAGKTTVQIFDIYDKGERWLTRHSLARKKAYMQDHEVEIGPLPTLFAKRHMR